MTENTFLTPNWPAPTKVKAYTTLRSLYQDFKTNIEAGKQLETLLNLPAKPIWLKQTHSIQVINAAATHAEPIADASFSDKPQTVCAVLTADCLPVLICNKQATHVAAIHAGWRGLSAGIIEATLDAINQKPDELLVWLGPAIGPQKFEVGKDVYDAFVSKHEASISAFTPLNNDKWLADLYALAKIRLAHRGISAIYGGKFCTYTQDDLFFSYRRDKGLMGRMASMIWLDLDC